MSTDEIIPLQYNPAATLTKGVGLSEADLAELAPRLLAARQAALDDVDLLQSGEEIPEGKKPLDSGFINLPDNLLSEYESDRPSSLLHRILEAARGFANSADRLILLGIGGSYMGARALWEGCCHPYWNELSRAERGGWPRIYFEGNNVDNDAMQGLVDLLARGKGIASDDDRWGIVVISKSGGTLETAVSFRQFFGELAKTTAGRSPAEKAKPLVIPVTGDGSRLEQLSGALDCQPSFPIPDGVGGRFSILTAVGLLPAAIIGLDIVDLLRGAAAMNEHFRTAPPEENVVLRYVGVGHLAETKLGCTTRVLSSWGKSMEAAGLWYDQLLSESLGKQEQGATPITAVNTRDLHSRGQQHQEGRRDKLITNLIIGRPNCDRLAIETQDQDDDDLNKYAGKTLPEIMRAALKGTNDAYAAENRPTADLTLPAADPMAMGQLFQMLMLATVVEGRLIGVNPYGQPGVEAYKKHMKLRLETE